MSSWKHHTQALQERCISVYINVFSGLKRSCNIAIIRPDLVSRADSLLQVPVVNVSSVCEAVNQNAGVGDQIILRSPLLVDIKLGIIRFVVIWIFKWVSYALGDPINEGLEDRVLKVLSETVFFVGARHFKLLVALSVSVKHHFDEVFFTVHPRTGFLYNQRMGALFKQGRYKQISTWEIDRYFGGEHSFLNDVVLRVEILLANIAVPWEECAVGAIRDTLLLFDLLRASWAREGVHM